MMTLVMGGAASGKSEFAEQLILQTEILPRYYIATMQPFDKECCLRIEKHRKMRAQKQFETIECYTGLADLHLPQKGAVLLECMSNLVANELYSPEGAGEEALSAILTGVEQLAAQSRQLVNVSNEVFSGGLDYAGDTDRYLRLLAEVNCKLAARAHRVCELVCGIPQEHKEGGQEHVDF